MGDTAKTAAEPSREEVYAAFSEAVRLGELAREAAEKWRGLYDRRYRTTPPDIQFY